ncbi:hypothetical protein RHMOL_Rhmol04G0359100 [Rhododendron molle]|uniref:Uncharacterized protein n=1 Tax=Rhododendron molle TaxID=49168 RepID=A0ACC0P8Y4_RHOML|nr:hypothetical protein RHMOL_Rhmol04G0359100 [Rhododendron molle]
MPSSSPFPQIGPSYTLICSTHLPRSAPPLLPPSSKGQQTHNHGPPHHQHLNKPTIMGTTPAVTPHPPFLLTHHHSPATIMTTPQPPLPLNPLTSHALSKLSKASKRA